jgi:hypothetical protein
LGDGAVGAEGAGGGVGVGDGDGEAVGGDLDGLQDLPLEEVFGELDGAGGVGAAVDEYAGAGGQGEVALEGEAERQLCGRAIGDGETQELVGIVLHGLGIEDTKTVGVGEGFEEFEGGVQGLPVDEVGGALEAEVEVAGVGMSGEFPTQVGLAVAQDLNGLEAGFGGGLVRVGAEEEFEEVGEVVEVGVLVRFTQVVGDLVGDHPDGVGIVGRNDEGGGGAGEGADAIADADVDQGGVEVGGSG